MVPYEYAQFKDALVNIDYHIEYDRHFYSVPYQYKREVVEIRATSTTVEILHRGKRIATHPRCFVENKHSTLPEHRPKNHHDWPPERLISWARTIGPSTAALLEVIMARREFPEQGYRSCLGILRLSKKFPESRLEAACKRALSIRGLSYKSVKSILDANLDQRTVAEKPLDLAIVHENIRGAAAFVPQPHNKEIANANTSDNRQNEDLETPRHGESFGDATGTEGGTGVGV